MLRYVQNVLNLEHILERFNFTDPEIRDKTNLTTNT